MLKVNTYSAKGTKLADYSLPKEFTLKANLNLLAQAVRVYEERGHIGLRKTKTRSEVNRTGKKVYKQKGTGGARHGSRRAPIYVGGGVAHGPRPLRRVLILPAKMRVRAKQMAISFKAQNKELVLVDGIGKIKKTSEAAVIFKKLAKIYKAKRFIIAAVEQNKVFRNLENIKAIPFKNLNAWQILTGGVLIIDKEVFK